MRAEHLPLWVTMALALASCGGGGSSSGLAGNTEIAVPFQSAGSLTSYNGSSASVSFDAGTGITTAGAPEPADTANNVVILNTDDNGGLQAVTVGIATTNGGPTQGLVTISNGIGDAVLATAPAIASLASTVAHGGANQLVYQGVIAGLSFSAYGAWLVNTAGSNYNVGTFALGTETAGAQMPATGTASYTGTTLGFGANSAAPFTFTGTAAIGVNFATNSVTNATFGNFVTQDVNDSSAGPTLPNLTGTGSIVGNKYTVPIAGTGLTGSAAGAFYGPAANETAGVFQANGGTVSLIGSFGAHH
jgi:hypothetical protein